MTGGYYGPKWPTFQNREFAERYQKKFGELPTHYAATFAGGQIMQQAIEKAGTLDKEKVRGVLLKDEFKCLHYPRVRYANEAGYTNINKYGFTGVLQWKNGKTLTVFPVELAETKMEYPFSPKW